uniref:hypothetical protein n=2 Tax=Roseivirga sp. TaxID=1964215 RepID=UPI004048B739
MNKYFILPLLAVIYMTSNAQTIPSSQFISLKDFTKMKVLKYYLFFFISINAVLSCEKGNEPTPVDVGLTPSLLFNVLNQEWKPDIIASSGGLGGRVTGFYALDYDKFKGEGDELSFTFVLKEDESIDYTKPFEIVDKIFPTEFNSTYKDYLENGARDVKQWVANKPEFAKLKVDEVYTVKERQYFKGSFEVVVCNGNLVPGCHTIKGVFENLQFFNTSREAQNYINQLKLID